MSRFTDKIDMRFEYVPAAKTDIRRSIARERKRVAEDQARLAAEAEVMRRATELDQQEAARKVRALKKGVI